MAASNENYQRGNAVEGQRKNSLSSDLTGPLKQIVAAVQGSGLASPPSGLEFEDSWLQLETTDENFHRYGDCFWSVSSAVNLTLLCQCEQLYGLKSKRK